MRAFIFKSVAFAFGLGFGAVASAQTVTQPAAGAVDTQKAQDTTLGQVVVTAQRRSEILSQTPIAASVLSGTELAEKGVVSADSLQFVSPSVVVNNFGEGLEFNIRGIGKAETSAVTTTGVITYRDGVPSFPGFFQGEPYYDVANIQILRGPQGTVVGQNSTGGAVFVNTNNPVIGAGYNGFVSASYGNYKDIGVQGALNLPIGDTFAARIALFDERRDSFYNITGPNGAAYTGNPGNVHQRAARISLLWEPTDNLGILWKTDSVDLDMGAYVASKPQNGFSTIPGTNTPNPYYSDLFNVTANAPQEAHDKFVRSILKVEYAADSGIKLRSITGYGKGTSKWVADFDGTANGIPALGPWVAVPGNKTTYGNTEETQISQEFNIISPDNQRVTWLLGAFALRNTYDFPAPDGTFEINYDTSLAIGPYAPYYKYQFNGSVPQRSQAVFGQIGFALTPNLKLDLGARSTNSSSGNVLTINQVGTAIIQDQTTEERNSSYKVSLGWKINPNNYLYALTATGFKPGGMNLKIAPALPADAFTKETIKSFEAGWKSNFDGGKGHLTMSGFYNDYDGFQVSVAYPLSPTFPVIGNAAGTTRVSGFEAEADYKIGALTLGGGISVVDSSLGQFYAVDQRFLNVPACNPNVGPASVSCVNLQGRQLTYSPPFTYNVSAKYDLALWGGKLTTTVNFGHVAEQWASLFQNALYGDRLAERNILGAQLTYQRGGTSVTAYGTNLTNQQYVAAHWLVSSGNLDFAGPPRQYGVKLTQSF